ncbi:MAG: LamG-like jellyroll fold domain-containing protein, partial [Euryarchaeota archaeon]|nr:LamG-like jellyroll fold domain-containing protein [Euryarchaeota archaeon]
MKWYAPYGRLLIVIAIIAVVVMFAGCVEDENPVSTPSPAPTPTQAVTPTETPEPTATLSPSQQPVSDVDYINDGGAVRVGAFNIPVFGKSKASKPEVMEVLGRIIRTYDVVAIQGIRDESQTALPALVDTVNAGNSQYGYVVGERLGRTTSREQYAYIYNTRTIELTDTPHSPHTYPEPAGTDSFHREPYIASFEAIACNFDFILITIHVDPDEATEEINALDTVVKYAQSTYPDEQEFIVMGNLNADCSYFDEDSSSTMSGSNYHWCIDNSVDTTTKSTDCTYDRIIITNPTASYFTGDSGVFRYDLEYGLTEDETTAVSDHYPVYAEFSCNGGTVSRSTSGSGTVTPTPTPAPTETGLVAHWKLDETNGTTAHDSVGSHNGTLVGSYTWTAGAPEGLNPMGAIGLHSTDGSDARYVDCGDGGDLDITGDRSVAAWFKIDDWNVEWAGLVTKGNGALGGYNLLRSEYDSVYGGHDDGVAFQVYGQTGTDITSQQVVRGEINVTDGKWHHAVGTYVCDYDDGGSLDVGLLSIYVDGVLDRDYVVKGGMTLTNNESVQINGMGGGFFTNSTIDDVRIYNKALSLEEVEAITPTPTPAPTETGLVAHWKLDETNGTTAHDSVGSHNGTLVGSYTWTAGAPEGLNPMGAIGLHSTDGSDARYVDCGDGGDLDITGDRSVAAWFKIDDWNVEWAGLVTKGNGALGGYNLLRSEYDSVYGGHDDGVAFQVYGQTGTDITSQQVVRGEINVTDGKWHHAVGTYVCDYDDGGSLDVGLLSIYVDGVLDRDYVVKGGMTLTNNESVQINGMGGGFFTNSTIDDVRIYNKALSLEEVRAIMGEFTSTDPVMWEYTEWAVDNPSWSGNEYDIVATVIFTHTSSGSTHTTEMFYDGSNTWKFRFT